MQWRRFRRLRIWPQGRGQGLQQGLSWIQRSLQPALIQRQASNEKALQKLCEDCDGIFGTLAQAIEELSIPRLKTTRPVPSYKGVLTLGNPVEYDSAMSIDVERYPRVMVQRPPAASNYVHRQDMAPSAPTDENADQDLAAVKNARTYQVIDDDAPGGKRDVEQEELAKGYSYGSTAVPISESDRNVTTFETSQGLDILGFVAKEQASRLAHHPGNDKGLTFALV